MNKWKASGHSSMADPDSQNINLEPNGPRLDSTDAVQCADATAYENQECYQHFEHNIMAMAWDIVFAVL